MAERIAPEDEARFWSGVRNTAEFFMGTAPVQRAMEKLVRLLDQEAIPYAIVGAMALNEYGHLRATSDVDVLLTREGLARFKARWLGRGYVEKFAGSKGLRDTENAVEIDVVVCPDPAVDALVGDRVRLLPLERLIELNLVSGMTAPRRVQDLADVLALIRVRELPRDFAERLDPSVREKFRELWEAAQHRDEE